MPKLLKSQQNSIFQLILDIGLNPADFKWESQESRKTPNDEVSILRFRDGDWYFMFDFSKRQHFTFFAPGHDRESSIEFPGSWNSQLAVFTQWLAVIKRELAAPDLWGNLVNYAPPQALQLDEETGNVPFNMVEFEHIQGRIEKIRTYLLEQFQGQAEAQERIEEQLTYVVNSAKRLGKKDWYNLAIGAIISLSMQLAFSVEQREVVYNLLKAALSGIMKFLS